MPCLLAFAVLAMLPLVPAAGPLAMSLHADAAMDATGRDGTAHGAGRHAGHMAHRSHDAEDRSKAPARAASDVRHTTTQGTGHAPVSPLCCPDPAGCVMFTAILGDGAMAPAPLADRDAPLATAQAMIASPRVPEPPPPRG